MTLSDFIDRFAAEIGMSTKALELHARRLREAKLLPERLGGRRVAVTSQSAASLIIAVLSAENAAESPSAVTVYGKLRLVEQAGLNRRFSGIRSLRDLVELGLESSHHDDAVAKIFNDGVLHVQRHKRFAEFSSGSGNRAQHLTFRVGPSYPPYLVQAPFRIASYLQTLVLVRLSIAMISPKDILPVYSLI